MKLFNKLMTAIIVVSLSFFALFGCSNNGNTKFEYLDFKDSSTKLEQGVISAGFITAGAPTAALTTLATSYTFKIMDIDEEHANELIKKYPYYTKYVIKANTYSCVKIDVNTVAILATLAASDEMSEDDVYKITKSIFEDCVNIDNVHAKEIEINQAIAGIGNVPMHKGAAKYYAEALSYESVEAFANAKGVTVSTKAGTEHKSTIKFATGGTTGTYYAFGGLLATEINTKTGLNIVPQSANGSGANINDLNQKNVEIAWVQNDVMNYAYNGTDMYKNAIQGYSAIGAIYPECIQIPANVNINSFDDLKGKSIAIGATGSGVYFNAVQILGLYGIQVK